MITDSATFDEILIETRVPILVEFAVLSRTPRASAVELELAATRIRGRALVLRVNTETLSGLAERYRISTSPTFVVFERGLPVDRRTGAMRQRELLELVGLP